MAWQSYNISFDDKSALFYYKPYRGGSDNSTGTLSSATTWVAYNTTGREFSYTTSLGGASVTLQLPAMVSAFWVYGECNASAVTVSRSWDGDALLNNATPDNGGILYSETGLMQDFNSVTFTVNDGKGPVTVTGATVAVKMGTNGSTIKATNISTVIESIPALNPFFSVNGNGSTWEGELAFGANDGLEAVIGTNTTGDFVTFEVNSSVAFAMYGVNGPLQGAFLVDINPPLPFNASAPATFNASSPWVMIEEIKYLVAGLNDTETYTVNFSNTDPGKQFNIGQVVLYSTVPPASPTTSASSGSSMHSRDALSRGSIAGATVGSVAAAMVLAFLVFAFFRQGKRRAGLAPFDIEPEATPVDTNNPQLSNGVQEVFTRHRISSIVSRPFVKSYVDPVDMVSEASTPQVLRDAEQPYRKSEDMVPELNTSTIAGPSTIAPGPSAPARVVLPTHAEDAGPVREELPPMYNPEWNNSTPGVA